MRVCCVNVGTKYGDEYVDKLHRGLKRHITKPFDFECRQASKFPGWWAKMELLNPSERTIVLDVDHVVTGNCDFLFDYDGRLCVRRNDWSPKRYDTCLMSLAPGAGRIAKDMFLANPKLIMDTFGIDQTLITAVEDADCWQDVAPGKTAGYKSNNLQAGPGNASLVHFHGQPKMHELPTGHWIERYWQ